MGILRNVGGWGEVDLDQRAITTEDDIVDLSELDRSDEQPNQPAPATQNGAAEHDEPSEGQPPATASQPHRTPREAPPPTDAPGREGDEDFDRWVADRAPALGSAVPHPSRARLRSPVTPESWRQAMLPRPRPALPRFAARNRRCRRSPAPAAGYPASASLSRPLGRLARPAAAIGALALSAGGTAIAINAGTSTTPRAPSQIATSNPPPTARQSNRASDTLSATIAAVTSELHALARAVPPARSTSHPPRNPRRHRPSHKVGTSTRRHPATVSEQGSTSAQTSPPPQTYNSTPAPVTSSTSQATAGSQTQSTSTSQPAFGQNGTLGPGRGAPGTQ